MPAVPAPAVAPFGGRRGQLEGARAAGCAVALRRRRGGDGGGSGQAGWRGAVSRRAARGPAGAGAALPPPGTSEEAAAESWSPAPAGAHCERPGSPAETRPAGALFRGWRCGRRCGPLGARRAALHPGAWFWLCVASAPTSYPSVTVCGKVARHRDLGGEGLATGQTDSFDCSHPGVPRLPG